MQPVLTTAMPLHTGNVYRATFHFPWFCHAEGEQDEQE